MKTMTYREAIRSALAEEMRRDNNVFVYGIDVADHKRIFGTTDGIVEEFGNGRCFSTPLSEDALTGFGLGVAMNGMRPVNVHMRADFLMLTMNQLANMISSTHYGTDGRLKVPMVIRAVIGRGWGQSYQHNKSLQSCFAHLPGLKVYMPATVSDAKNMTICAIRDDNPVLLIEHRWLYDAVGEVAPYTEDFCPSSPRILKPGDDITIVATSWMTVEAMQAATVLEKNGIRAEIINVASISPFMSEPIVESVLKTRCCVIADNDWIPCGFSAEAATQIYQSCYGILKAPVERIGYAFSPCPCTRVLETHFYGGAEQIIRATEKMLDLAPIDLSGEDFYTYERKFKGPF